MTDKNTGFTSGVYTELRERRGSRSCSKCGGRQEIGLDPDAGIYKSCVNCGNIEYTARAVNFREQSLS